ncbi:MAG: OmpA family protein [Candidatus Longimicrobiales bacterium M2_2A_002]
MLKNTTKLALAAVVVSGTLGLTACSSWSNTAKGGVIGAGAGGAIGAAVGSQIGETAKGAIIGAAVGGAAGAVIGNQMDKQAEELRSEIEGATVRRVGEGIVVTFDTGILFNFDSAALRDEARDNLTELANHLDEYERTDVLIVGHTDSIGSETYNQRLSERRAESAATFVAQHGVASSRISTRGMGESDPISDNSTAEGRQENRRVEVVIYASEEWREEVTNRQ